MEVVPATVGEASRRWDDEHLDLQLRRGRDRRRADRRLHRDGVRDGGAVHLGLVSGSPATPATSARRAPTRCAPRSSDFLATDDAAFDDFVALADFLEERR